MKTIKTLVVTKLAVLATLMMGLSAFGGPPVRSTGFVFEDLILDSAGNPPESDSTPIFNKGGLMEGCTTLPPILAPDGHQVTAGEWRAVKGSASIKCVGAGTHVVLHLSGLIPGGVYTIWLATFEAPGADPTLEHLIGLGTLGPDDGSGNTIVASASGQGHLSATQPAGGLSVFGTSTGCLDDEFEYHLLVAYHIDSLTHGKLPGPSCNYLEAFDWGFKP